MVPANGIELLLSPVKSLGNGDVCMYSLDFPEEAKSNAQLSIELATIAKDHKVFVGVGTLVEDTEGKFKAA